MRNYLQNLDRKTQKYLKDIAKQAEQLNVSVYIVGGIVRDILLRRKNLDLDIVVEGDAIALVKRLAKQYKIKPVLYPQFGTATLNLTNGVDIDFATARKERYAQSGALPKVMPGTLVEDLYRRDFTINAMAISINQDSYGQLIDYFDGSADLKAKTIAVLHDKSFKDDPTRILRAIRFEQRFQCHMNRSTLALAKDAVKKKYIGNVKPPRYFKEIQKIFSEPSPKLCLERMRALDCLKIIDPKLNLDLHLMCLLQRNITAAARKKQHQGCEYWGVVYFMGLLEKSSTTTIERILKKFPFKKEEAKAISQLSIVEQTLESLSKAKLSPSDVYQLLEPLAKATVYYLRVRTNKRLVCQRIDRYLTTDAHMQLAVDGSQLKRLGFASGQAIGRALNTILLSKIDQKVKTKNDEIRLAKTLLVN